MKGKKNHEYRLCVECFYFCNVLEENKFCPQCGSKLINKCPHCEAGIDYPYAKYCGKCGQAFGLKKINRYEF